MASSHGSNHAHGSGALTSVRPASGGAVRTSTQKVLLENPTGMRQMQSNGTRITPAGFARLYSDDRHGTLDSSPVKRRPLSVPASGSSRRGHSSVRDEEGDERFADAMNGQ